MPSCEHSLSEVSPADAVFIRRTLGKNIQGAICVVLAHMEDSSIVKEKYYDQAVACVKDDVLPAQMKLYQSCDGDLDRVYGEAMNGNGYFGKVIESGHVYELGYWENSRRLQDVISEIKKKEYR